MRLQLASCADNNNAKLSLSSSQLGNLSRTAQQADHVQSPKQASPDSEPISSEKVQIVPEASLPMRRYVAAEILSHLTELLL